MRFSDCGEDMAKTMFFGCRPVGKAKFILRFKKTGGRAADTGALFTKSREGRVPSRFISLTNNCN